MTTSMDNLLLAVRSQDPDRRQQAAMQLGANPTAEGSEQLVAAMVAESDDYVRETLIWAVVTRGKAAVPALLAALDDPSNDREPVLHTLSKIGDPATVPAIAPYADASDPVVAAKAWWALGRIANDDCLAPLLRQLGNPDAARRVALTRAFLQFGGPAVPALADALRHPSSAVRTHASGILVRLADGHNYRTVERRGGRTPEGARLATEAITNSKAVETDRVLTIVARNVEEPHLAQVAAALATARARA